MRQIGSGDTAAILGFSSYKGPMAAWNRIMGFDDSRDNEAMRIGREMELPIMKLAAWKMKWPSFRQGKPNTHPQHPWMRATEDFTIDEPAIVECKWCSEWMFTEWHDPEGELCVPRGYFLQVQHQMEVTGLPRAYVASIIDGSVVTLPVDRDPELGADLVELLGKWYRDYVVTETPPSMPDGSDAYQAYLIGRYPQIRCEQLLQATDEDERLIAELHKLDIEKKHATLSYDRTAQLLMERIKDAPGVVSRDGHRIRWIERKPYVMPPSEAREVKGTRYIKPYWKKEAA